MSQQSGATSPDDAATLRIDLSRAMAARRRCTLTTPLGGQGDTDPSPPASPSDISPSGLLDDTGSGSSSGSTSRRATLPCSSRKMHSPGQGAMLKVSLWHDSGGWFQSYFHGEVRITLDANTLRPENGRGQPHVAWSVIYFRRKIGMPNFCI